jgi:hypothetical protein
MLAAVIDGMGAMADSRSDPLGSRVLAGVNEGMTVYDSTDVKVGKVRSVFLGGASEDAIERGAGPATAPEPSLRGTSPIIPFAEAFGGESPLLDELRERLLRHGFIRIDTAGLFAADCYAMPEQVAHVSGDTVTLRIRRDELIKR